MKADFIDVELEKVLQEVLKDQGMDYKFMDDYIMIVRQNVLPQSVEKVTIKGTVVDHTNEPLPGVTVMLKGTQLGTATDVNGKYSLTLPGTGKDSAGIFYDWYENQRGDGWKRI